MKTDDTLIIIQARMGSTRLPGKMIKILKNKTAIQWVIDACSKSKEANYVVATSTEKNDNIIKKMCEKTGARCYRGSENNVLKRFIDCAKEYGAKTIIRICGDQPFIDIEIIDRAIKEYKQYKPDILNTRVKPIIPRGIDVEVVSIELLEQISQKTTKKEDIEHVTKYIYDNHDKYDIRNLTKDEKLFRPEIKLTLDTKQDLKFCRKLMNELPINFSTIDIINALDKSPKIYYSRNKMSTLNVLFLITAGTLYGTGHIKRSQIISKELKKKIKKINFLVETDNPDHVFLKNIIRLFNTTIITKYDSESELEQIEKIKPDVVIIDKDSRTYDEYSINKLVNKYHTILFDVLGNAKYESDMIFNRSINEATHNYLTNKPIIYCGGKYVALEKIKIKKQQEDIKKILITFGGEDPEQLTEQVTKQFFDTDYKIDVILVNSERRETLRKLVKNKNIKVKNAVKSLSKILANYDLIICNGGSTLIESCVSCTPRIAIPQNKYEEKYIQSLEQRKACVGVTEKEISKIKMIISEQKKQILETALTGRQIYDSEGTKRIVERILFQLANNF